MNYLTLTAVGMKIVDSVMQNYLQLTTLLTLCYQECILEYPYIDNIANVNKINVWSFFASGVIF
jgi:hypothetical protein